jgi:hypothetical protein
MLQYRISSQDGYSSTEYSVSWDIPVQNSQSVGIFQYRLPASRDTPLQNIQSGVIFQYRIFRQLGYSSTEYSVPATKIQSVGIFQQQNIQSVRIFH